MQKTGIKYIFSQFSANALQIGFSQAGALFLFWLASKELLKEDFGLFNWYFAIYGTITSIFSFGFDFIVIKRVSSKNDLNAARIQLIQSIIICGISTIVILLMAFSPALSTSFKNSLFLFVAFQFTYLSMPFKNTLTGRELFRKSAQAVIISNCAKIALVIYLYLIHAYTLFNVSLILAIANFIELFVYALNAYQALDRNFFGIKPNFIAYKEILRESLPQLGVIVFDSAFARIDWILLGVLSVNAAVNTAEYSFAYKIFEVSRLPLLVLAPILFTRFSKLFYNPQLINDQVTNGIMSFFKLELVVGMLIPIVLNLAWVPLMQFFTSGKYGPENHHVYFLLSLTIPFIYAINFMWTMAFAQGQLKLTMLLSVLNSCLNILLNILLIPRFGQTGAASAFLICNVVMLPIYIILVKQSQIKFPLWNCVLIVLIASGITFISYFLPFPSWLKCSVAIIMYFLVIYSFKILTFAEIKSLKHFIKKD